MTTKKQTIDTNDAKPKRSRKRSGKRAWVFQFAAHVAKYGKTASWYVGWIDPRGKRHAESCGPGEKGRTIAARRQDKLHCQLVERTYENQDKMTWEQFFKLYESRVLDGKPPRSAQTARGSIKVFAKTMKPTRMRLINSGTIEEFTTRRLAQKTKKGNLISAATVNRDLRYVRQTLRRAKKWGIIDDVPEFEFQKLPERMPTFVPPDHFAAIYAACDRAKRPKRIPNVAPADWWRALLILAYMTGWRIGQILSLRWADIDLEAGTALSRADDNKGKRDCLIPLHSLVVEHLKRIETFGPHVFQWDTNRRALWIHFAMIQAAAKTHDNKPLPKAGKGGRCYGFHDLRRGFATMNAEGMDLFQLQGLMQHKSLSTTKLYVNMANRLTGAVQGLYVPDVGRKAVAASL
jgi:integrase